MKTFLTMAAIALAAWAAAPGVAEEQPADGVRALLDEVLESMGGREKLAGVKSLAASYDGVYSSGAMTSPYEGVTTWSRDGAFLWEMTTQAFSGAMGIDEDGTPWNAFMVPPARVRGPMAKSMGEWSRQWEMLLLEPFLAHEGLTVSAGEGVQSVVFETAEGDRFEIHYESSKLGTFPVRLTGPMTHSDGRKGRMVAEWSEPKEFDGIVLPSKVVWRAYVGDELKETVKETTNRIEWNPDLEEGAFAMPESELVFDLVALKDVPAISAVVMVHEGPYEEMGATMGRLKKLVAEKELIATGGMIATYFVDPATVEDPAELRSEIAMPVFLMGAPPELPEGVTVRQIPAGKVAALPVRGEYGTVEAAAIPKVTAWMAENDHAFGGPPSVVYFHDEESTVPEDQVSEVRIPVAK